jgi:hypothetical protein
MKVDCIERRMAACYATEGGGHFSPRRDNGPGLSAYRGYAVSINVNDGFEYGAEPFRPPPCWAVIFPCVILHQEQWVAGGVHYTFLPFVIDGVEQSIASPPASVGEQAAVDRARAVVSAPSARTRRLLDGGSLAH